MIVMTLRKRSVVTQLDPSNATARLVLLEMVKTVQVA